MSKLIESFKIIYDGLFSKEACGTADMTIGYIQCSLDTQFAEDTVATEAECDPENGHLTARGWEKAHKRVMRMQVWTPFGWWLYKWGNQIVAIIPAVICIWREHDWICEDWGEPESGGMGGTCKRCGFSFHHPMY